MLHFGLDIKVKDPNGIEIEKRFEELSQGLSKAVAEAIHYNHIKVTPRFFELVLEEDCPILIFDDYSTEGNLML